MNSTKAQEGFRLHVASGLQYELLAYIFYGYKPLFR